MSTQKKSNGKKRNGKAPSKSFEQKVKKVLYGEKEVLVADQFQEYAGVLYPKWDSANAVNLTAISEGLGDINNRVGKSIKLRKLMVTLIIHNDPAAAPSTVGDFYRLTIVRTLDSDHPTATQLYQTTHITQPLNNTVYKSKELFIMHDKLYQTSTGFNNKIITLEFNLNNIEATYDGVTADSGTKGNLFLFFGSTSAGTLITGSSAYMNSRVLYIDN